jgi:hypothetical protein
MAAFEQIIYAQHADQPYSCRSLIGKYASLAPFAPEPSGFLRQKHFNFRTRSVRELGTFGSQYAKQAPPRLRQPVAKTRIPTAADS